MLTMNSVPLEGQRSVMAKEAVTRVVLADDHDVVRQGLKRLLDRAPEIVVVGEASDGLEAINSVRELRPDVLLLDIEMPKMDGIEVARRLQDANIRVRILILSAYDDREYIRSLLDIGVSGYLVKGEAPGKIVEAVRGVAQGQKGWVSPQVRKQLEKLHEPDDFKQTVLTYWDLEILRGLRDNRSETDLARAIKLHEKELGRALQALYKKIGVQNRQEAVELSTREGWI